MTRCRVWIGSMFVFFLIVNYPKTTYRIVLTPTTTSELPPIIRYNNAITKPLMVLDFKLDNSTNPQLN